MILYFAGYSTDKEIFSIPQAKNLLESYLLFRNKDYVKWHQERNILDRNLFLDSGAFSAATRGIKINIQDYCDFIKKYESHIKVYAGLDVIGDHIATKKNQDFMEAQGLHPLPTFHFKSPMKELHALIDRYEYIALGGLVPIAKDRKTLKTWLDICFRDIVKKGTKVHGFGVNAFWAWERYPFYSVDATSWLMGGKFRRIVKFNGKDLVAYNKRSNISSEEKILTYKEHYSTLNQLNVVEYQKAADYATKLWENRGVVWK